MSRNRNADETSSPPVVGDDDFSGDFIVVKGARVHNLKNISVKIPRNKLTVITGVSGSGKSSLAFDTLFAEGQRRYLDSLPAYTRQFLDKLDRPDVDSVRGLSPAIAIEQHSSEAGPRSTLATATELHDYLRVLFASIGVPHCPCCDKVVEATSAEKIVEKILDSPEGTKLTLLAPLRRKASGPGKIKTKAVIAEAESAGFVRVRIDGTIYAIDDLPTIDESVGHDIEAVVDRIVVKPDIRRRVTDSVELSMQRANGSICILRQRPDEDEGLENYSEHFECPDCGVAFDKFEPSSFSFNSHKGACPSCEGLGMEAYFDPALVVPDRSLSLADGAIAAWKRGPKRLIATLNMMLRSVAAWQGVDTATPWRELPEKTREVIMYGSKGVEFPITRKVRGNIRRSNQAFEGVLPNLERRLRESESEGMKTILRSYMSRRECKTCGGSRYKPEVLSCRIPHGSGQEKNIADLLTMPVAELRGWVSTLPLTSGESLVVNNIISGLVERLDFLVNVGLGYLTGNRASSTLSGGEMQRIRLAAQIGQGLSGIMYVLDEPTIGLHPHDNSMLIAMLRRLQRRGNTLIVVEHDEAMIREADYVIDIGPGAGRGGGEVVFAGPPEELAACEASSTAHFLTGKEKPLSPERRVPDGRFLKVRNANKHNLHGVDADFPLGCITVVTGVSGSGKSSLVDDVLCSNLGGYLAKPYKTRGDYEFVDCDRVEGVEMVDKTIVIDKSPLGRSSRSNALTYTGAFDNVRKLFASTPAAKARGYTNSRFSFNVKGGRCEVCKGDGRIRFEMSFLPDVTITCEQCGGHRYNRETLEVRYAGHNIADVLEMTVHEALDLFAPLPKIARRIQTLDDVGLGYMPLGQPVSMLSSGEAQRLRLSAELARPPEKHTVYILDEPTTGLHFLDVRRLMMILARLRDAGHTVIIVEHNPDVMNAADWIVDMGPGGGNAGGRVVASGPLEKVASCPESLTAFWLRARRP